MRRDERSQSRRREGTTARRSVGCTKVPCHAIAPSRHRAIVIVSADRRCLGDRPRRPHASRHRRRGLRRHRGHDHRARGPTRASSCGFGWCTTASSSCGTTTGSTPSTAPRMRWIASNTGLSRQLPPEDHAPRRRAHRLARRKARIRHVGAGTPSAEARAVWPSGAPRASSTARTTCSAASRRVRSAECEQSLVVDGSTRPISPVRQRPGRQRGVHFGNRRARLAFAAALLPLAESRLQQRRGAGKQQAGRGNASRSRDGDNIGL